MSASVVSFDGTQWVEWGVRSSQKGSVVVKAYPDKAAAERVVAARPAGAASVVCRVVTATTWENA